MTDSGYLLVVFAHVVVAIATFALMAIALFALIRAKGASTTEEIGTWLRGAAAVARWLPVGSLLLLLSGVFLAWSRWGFGSGWLEVSAAALLLISLAGAGVSGPRMRALGQAVMHAGSGPVPGSIRARLADPVLWSTEHAIAGAVVAVVFLMEIKPALLESVFVVALGSVLGAASGIPFWNRAATSNEQSIAGTRT
jgi:hypothetical protein